MWRLRDERGAVAVMVAVLLVPLMAFAAIAVDVAGMWSEHQQLRNGADAGALAIAQNCGSGACGTTAVTAQQLADANHIGAGATGAVVSLSASQVTVRATATRAHLFAPVLGMKSSQLSAQATVAWGSPNGGTSALPLAFSWCEWKQQTGGGLPTGTTPTTIYFPKTSDTGCTGPSNNFTPGGFSWLKTSGTCSISSAIAGPDLLVDPGISAPSSCSNDYIVSLQNKPVLLPIFDRVAGTGSGATYHVFGYAAFILSGYYLGGQYSSGKPAPCSGNDRCIQGYFTKFVDLTEAFTYSAGAPALGASVIELTS
jgi:Flp pilus assembly protein TadG